MVEELGSQKVCKEYNRRRRLVCVCKKMCQNLSYSAGKLNGKIEEVQWTIVKKTGLISEIWTNRTPNFTRNLTKSSTNSQSIKRYSSLNMLQNLWCQFCTSFDLVELIIISFNHSWENWCWIWVFHVQYIHLKAKLWECWNIF